MNLLDHLLKFPKNINIEELQKLEAERQTWRERPSNKKYNDCLRSLPDKFSVSDFEIKDGVVTFLSSEDQAQEQVKQIETAAKELIPWKKGPFNLSGLIIDAEWRSDHKWKRIEALLPDLKNKRVLDIGCNNGYFLYQMLKSEPELLLGIDPVIHFASQFQFLEKFHADPRMHFKLWGVEHVGFFENFFDVIFSMGIIYHHRNPLAQLIDMRNALRPGGSLIIETIGIPGDSSHALFPEDRYAKMKNVWFVPTMNCFINWVQKARFIDVEIISDTLLTEQEQRRTQWCNEESESLKDFLDPADPTKTIEGHPAPRRFCLKATKRGKL